MFKRLVLRCEDNATARSAEELQKGLAEDLGPRHTVMVDDEGKALKLTDLGLSVSLISGDQGKLTGAVMDLPDDANLGNVSLVSRAFLGLGWTF